MFALVLGSIKYESLNSTLIGKSYKLGRDDFEEHFV